ncbi:MAG: DUF4837 family protein [Rikenellaceae bacterium]
MKKLQQLLAVLLLLATTVGCDALRMLNDDRVVSQGLPYELIVVCNQPEWEGALGDSLRAVLSAPIPNFQQDEPYYDVVRILEKDYKNLLVRHRNILRCVINPAADSTWMAVQYDVNASPQIVLTLQGATTADMARYVGENGEAIVAVLESAERDRDISYNKKYSVAALTSAVKEEFGFDMLIPNGFTMRNSLDDFMWISYEYPTASQGIIIHSREATAGVVELQYDRLIEGRNRAVAQIPGPTDGTYMGTYLGIEPDHRLFRLNGRVWAELRGFWQVEGGFMGGPFVSYSTVDDSRGEVITLDMYIYSPKLGKRNFVRGMEHLLFSVSFDEDKEKDKEKL